MKSSNKPWTRVGATQFVADTARERVRKATQLADAIGGYSIEKQWTVHWKQPRRLTKRLEMQSSVEKTIIRVITMTTTTTML
ncbi:hypothetical protein NC653_027893 [Populus alba x Populus x berolinensis]|nr:hypothetical protein NC653_027893 [Populus alba x Populus x berolinensis]